MDHEEKKDSVDSKGDAGLRLAAFSVRKPVTITMVAISVVVMGLISIWKIPLVMLPSISFPGLFVSIPYPNATPEQILESITKPIEEVISTIPGIQRMSSFSGEDSSEVQIFFNWGQEIDMLRGELREKLERARADLPEDVNRIQIMNFSTEDIPILDATISAKRDLRNAYDFLDVKVKKPIERVPGVGEVELWGVQRQQLDIYLRLDDLKRYRVDVGKLFQRLDSANLNVSLGSVDEADLRYGAVSRGVISSVDDVSNFPVNDNGLVLSQVADIDFDNPVSNSGQHLNGEYSIGISIRKTSEANTVETVRRVHEVIEGFKQDPALEGIEMHVWHDAGKEITRGLSGLLNAGTVGAFLAVAVLFLFLRRIGASLMIGLAIPFSIISAIGFLYLTGNTLNMLSMMGLMLATGMLVDNAVVVLESIYQKLEKGQEREEAARNGTAEVTTAVVAATLTSIIIFVPLVFGANTSFSIWLGHAGRSIILALLCSLFISLTLIPVAVARFLDVNVSKRSLWQQKLSGWFEPWILRLGRAVTRRSHISPRGFQQGWVYETYLRMVDWPLRHRFAVGLVLVPLMIAGSVWLLVNHVPDNTPEAEEMSGLRISYEFSENYHYAKIEQDYVGPVEKFLNANKDRLRIKNFMSRYWNNGAWTQVYFDDERISLDDMPAIRKQIADGLPVVPGAKIKPGMQEGAQNQSFISANIYGDDSRELTRIGNDLKQRLLKHTDFSEVFTELDQAQQEVQIRLNRALARKYGISPETVSGVLGIVVRARQVRGFRTPDGEVEMWVRMNPADLQNLDDLESIVVGAGPAGEPIELRQVAHFAIEKIPARIQREDRRSFTYVNAVYTGDKREEGQKIFTEVLNDYAYPQGYGWSFGFWTQRQQQENQEFVFNILLALFMVYFVMASLFESLAHPFAIMFSLPFAVVGVALFLWVTRSPFNPMAWIGSLVLIGIVVNNGIVLVDHINNLRRKGMDRPAAIREGCRERLRPIVMTAATTVVGLIPLAFGDQGFFDMKYFPMARTVMGGLIASTVLTLIVLPTYYSLMDDFSIWCRRIWQNSAASAVPRPVDSSVPGD
jgi:hydrophobic/amphiphilic exporter-1 (mainly G- bacteria), HAE1 family